MTLDIFTKKFLGLSMEIHNNAYLKNTKFGRLMKRIFEMYREHTGKLHIIPAFSFSLLNLYLLAVSYPNKDADWAVRETLRTYGRAMRDMIMNSWDISELRKLDERLVKFAEGEGIFNTNDFHSILFPIHIEDEEKRAKTYELIGLIFTSMLSNKTEEGILEAFNSEHYTNITDINLVAGLAQDIFNAYEENKAVRCGDMLKSENLESALDYLYNDDGTEVGVTPLDLIILTFNDMLNTNVDTSFKFINRRLINNHTLRQMVYSLYARFFLDSVLVSISMEKNISRIFEFRLEYYLLDSVKEVFTGLSGNLRILDDVVMWEGERGNQYNYALKILNVGIKGEEIFDLWLEIRRDIGIADMDSLLFIPMYPEQNLYGAWEKFNLDKRLAKVERRKEEGSVVVLTLNHLYDLIRIMLINVDSEPENKAFEVFEQIVKENLL